MKTGGLRLSTISVWHDARDGLRDATPIMPAVLPFAGVFGAMAVEQGLSLGEIMFASMTIFAGASQYAMVELMGQQVPAWSIVMTVFAVNFRHVLYSASVGRHLTAFTGVQKALAFFLLVDPQFAAAETRAMTKGLRPAYYFAYASVLYTTWVAANLLGALFGQVIESPEYFGLDFILPLYFTGLVLGFHTRPNFVPVLVVSVLASLGAFFAIGSPWHISVGGLAGLIVAALLSRPSGSLAHE